MIARYMDTGEALLGRGICTLLDRGPSGDGLSRVVDPVGLGIERKFPFTSSGWLFIIPVFIRY